MEDLTIPGDNQDFFAVLPTRRLDSEGYVVEIGGEGLPDQWMLPVFDSDVYEPCYTFVSPQACWGRC